jgi:hypothetical protein
LLIAVVAVVLPVLASANEHRSRAVAREFQLEHPCPSTGLPSPCPGYWRDHIVPLACGGPDAVENMQWQTVAAARPKDNVGAKIVPENLGRMLTTDALTLCLALRAGAKYAFPPSSRARYLVQCA